MQVRSAIRWRRYFSSCVTAPSASYSKHQWRPAANVINTLGRDAWVGILLNKQVLHYLGGAKMAAFRQSICEHLLRLAQRTLPRDYLTQTIQVFRMNSFPEFLDQ